MSSEISDKQITQKVNHGIRNFFKNEIGLLENNLHERTIAHHFAKYLENEFNGFDVDPEYNRNGADTKTLDDDPIFPDIIVHNRTLKSNLLVIEIKKDGSSKKRINKDRTNLKKMTSYPKYKYQLGILIIFYVEKKASNGPILEYYKEGKQIYLSNENNEENS